MNTRLLSVNRAATAIEATAAIAILLAVSFFVATQDNASMSQAQKDARLAMAQLWLENEVALCRVSQPPWRAGGTNNRLSLYTTAGTSREVRLAEVGVDLPGLTNNLGGYSGRFGGRGRGVDPATAERVLVQSAEDGLDGLIFQEYRVTLRVPFATGGADGGRDTNVYTREHRRVFQSGN